jgi:hypothetical protein
MYFKAVMVHRLNGLVDISLGIPWPSWRGAGVRLLFDRKCCPQAMQRC